MSNRRRPLADAPGGALPDVLSELREEHHLTHRQYDAGALLVALLQAGHGSSSGIVTPFSDRIDSSRRMPLYPAGGGSPVAVDTLLKSLRGHERELMRFLVLHRELPRGSLADWGRTRSGYKTTRTQRAVTVGRITALLDSLAEIALPLPG